MKAGGAHLLPPLPGADQRALHHRRQVEQHRHPRDLPRHGRRAARALLDARRRRRSTSSSAAAGRTWCAACGASPRRCDALGAALPLLRLRQRDLRGRELRQEDRRVDEGRRPRADRRHARHRSKPATAAEAAPGDRTMHAPRHPGLPLLPRHPLAGRHRHAAATGSASSTSSAANRARSRRRAMPSPAATSCSAPRRAAAARC